MCFWLALIIFTIHDGCFSFGSNSRVHKNTAFFMHEAAKHLIVKAFLQYLKKLSENDQSATI